MGNAVTVLQVLNEVVNEYFEHLNSGNEKVILNVKNISTRFFYFYTRIYLNIFLSLFKQANMLFTNRTLLKHPQDLSMPKKAIFEHLERG